VGKDNGYDEDEDIEETLKRQQSHWRELLITVAMGVLVIGGIIFIVVFQMQDAASSPQVTSKVGPTATALALASRTAAVVERIEQAATAQAAGTATAIERPTMAILQATASARYPNLVYGPVSGSLPHIEPDLRGNQQSFGRAFTSVSNFIVEARFYNPYSTSVHRWTAAVVFRDVNPNQNYRFVIDSDKVWRLLSLGTNPVDMSGQLDNLDISTEGSNLVRLTVQGSKLTFVVNEKQYPSLDVLQMQQPGDVSLIVGALSGDIIPGRETRFDDFTIWSLDQQ
jgi:hypothetical protein